jgi:hypothetical protein
MPSVGNSIFEYTKLDRRTSTRVLWFTVSRGDNGKAYQSAGQAYKWKIVFNMFRKRYTAAELFWFLRNMWLSARYGSYNNVMLWWLQKSVLRSETFFRPEAVGIADVTRGRNHRVIVIIIHINIIFYYFCFRFSTSLFRGPVPSVRIIFV